MSPPVESRGPDRHRTAPVDQRNIDGDTVRAGTPLNAEGVAWHSASLHSRGAASPRRRPAPTSAHRSPATSPARCGRRSRASRPGRTHRRAHDAAAARSGPRVRRATGAAPGGVPILGARGDLDHRLGPDRRPGRRPPDRLRRRLAHRRQLPGGAGQGHDALRPRDPPHGGDTLFADTTAAYEALDDRTRRSWRACGRSTGTSPAAT